MEVKHCWVVDLLLGHDTPVINRYELKELHKAGVTVYVRAGSRFIKPAAGRSFFHTQEDLDAWLKTWLTKQAGSFEKRAARLREMLATGNLAELVTVVPNTPWPQAEDVKL